MSDSKISYRPPPPPPPPKPAPARSPAPATPHAPAAPVPGRSSGFEPAHAHPVNLEGRAAPPVAPAPLPSGGAQPPAASPAAGQLSQMLQRAHIDPEAARRFVFSQRVKQLHLDPSMAMRLHMGTLDDAALARVASRFQSPQRERYTVQAGDTLYQIASSRLPPGTAPEEAWGLAYEIAQENGVADPAQLSAGSTLQLPPAGSSSAPAPAATTSATAPAGSSQPYDLEAANEHMGQFRYAEEGAAGTRFSESVAMMAINGGQPDYGADGALNCNQACAEAQQFFRGQTPPVNTEVVVVDDHAVLRMPDGTYYDPSRAMNGGPPGDPRLSASEGQRYNGARGISVAERDAIAAEARRAVAGLPPGTPEHVREHLAVGAARQMAGQVETSANLLANDADGQPATVEEARTRAEEARTRAQTAAASGDPAAAEDAANYALNTMREANQLAQAQGQPLPYPLADQTPDAMAAGRLSAQQQTELFGAPLPLSQEAVVQTDVAALQGAPNPAAAATQLEQMLATASPEYRQALLSNPEVQRILGQFATYEPPPGDPQYQEGVNSLVRLAEAVGPEQAHLLTDPIAANYTLEQTYTYFLPALRSASSAGGNMEDSLGVSFAVSLDASMHEMGKADFASDVHNVATEAVAALQQQFGTVSEEVNQLQQELYLFLQEFGPAMTPEEQQNAINAFMEKHRDVYGRFEKMGGLLAGTMGVIQSRGMANEEMGYESISEVLAYHMPALSMTQAGSEFLQDAIQRASAGEPSFLNVALSIAKDNDDYAKAMGSTMLSALGSRASQLIASGQLDAAQTMLRGMEGFAPLFGLPEDQFSSVLGSINNLVANPGASPAEAEANLRRTLDDIGNTLGDSTASRMMSAFAVGMAGVVFAQGLSNWDQADLANRVATVAAGVEMGAEGGLLLAKIWGDTAFARVAPRLLQPIAEKVLPLVGIGLDAWQGIQALGQGDYGRAGLHGVSLVGGVLMMAGGPVGVLAGGALVVGSAIGLSILDNDEARKKAREEFLRDAGLPEDVIRTLVDAEPGRIEELVGMGFDYSQLVRMATLAPDMFTQSSGEGFLMERVRAFQQQTGLDADRLMGMFEAMAAASPGTSPADITSGFFQLLNSPMPPQTEEGWIAYFNEVAQAYAGNDDDVVAMMQALVQYLQST